MRTKPRTAIIGAGIAGITCARSLQEAGIGSVLFEKSRGIGGRLATRRLANDLTFDHGAQYFTAQSADFRRFLDVWGAGAVLPWHPRGRGNTGTESDWLVSVPGMNGFLRQAASGLDVRFESAVTAVERSNDRWKLKLNAAADVETFDRVIITAPAEQAIALTPFSQALQASLSTIRMSPCWAIMFALKTSSGAAPDVLYRPSSDISWIARNSGKPWRAPDAEAWVAHASPNWSRQHLELDKETALARLLEQTLPLLGLKPADITYADAHRWRFARVEQPAGEAFLSDETGTVFVCGDGCLGPRVEAAFQSASALATFIASEAGLKP